MSDQPTTECAKQPSEPAACCEVPLVESLRSVPPLARVLVEDSASCCHGTRTIPVGDLCHKAAEELRKRDSIIESYHERRARWIRTIDALQIEVGRLTTRCNQSSIAIHPFPKAGAVSSRDQVYRVIDGEREYQATLESTRGGNVGKPHTVTDELTMLATYLRKAQDAYTNNPSVAGVEIEALHVIRKLAAICVRCMEFNGAPYRIKSTVTAEAAERPDAACQQMRGPYDACCEPKVRKEERPS